MNGAHTSGRSDWDRSRPVRHRLRRRMEKRSDASRDDQSDEEGREKERNRKQQKDDRTQDKGRKHNQQEAIRGKDPGQKHKQQNNGEEKLLNNRGSTVWVNEEEDNGEIDEEEWEGGALQTAAVDSPIPTDVGPAVIQEEWDGDHYYRFFHIDEFPTSPASSSLTPSKKSSMDSATKTILSPSHENDQGDDAAADIASRSHSSDAYVSSSSSSSSSSYLGMPTRNVTAPGNNNDGGDTGKGSGNKSLIFIYGALLPLTLMIASFAVYARKRGCLKCCRGGRKVELCGTVLRVIGDGRDVTKGGGRPKSNASSGSTTTEMTTTSTSATISKTDPMVKKPRKTGRASAVRDVAKAASEFIVAGRTRPAAYRLRNDGEHNDEQRRRRTWKQTRSISHPTVVTVRRWEEGERAGEVKGKNAGEDCGARGGRRTDSICGGCSRHRYHVAASPYQPNRHFVPTATDSLDDIASYPIMKNGQGDIDNRDNMSNEEREVTDGDEISYAAKRFSNQQFSIDSTESTKTSLSEPNARSASTRKDARECSWEIVYPVVPAATTEVAVVGAMEEEAKVEAGHLRENLRRYVAGGGFFDGCGNRRYGCGVSVVGRERGGGEVGDGGRRLLPPQPHPIYRPPPSPYRNGADDYAKKAKKSITFAVNDCVITYVAEESTSASEERGTSIKEQEEEREDDDDESDAMLMTMGAFTSLSSSSSSSFQIDAGYSLSTARGDVELGGLHRARGDSYSSCYSYHPPYYFSHDEEQYNEGSYNGCDDETNDESTLFVYGGKSSPYYDEDESGGGGLGILRGGGLFGGGCMGGKWRTRARENVSGSLAPPMVPNPTTTTSSFSFSFTSPSPSSLSFLSNSTDASTVSSYLPAGAARDLRGIRSAATAAAVAYQGFSDGRDEDDRDEDACEGLARRGGGSGCSWVKYTRAATGCSAFGLSGEDCDERGRREGERIGVVGEGGRISYSNVVWL